MEDNTVNIKRKRKSIRQVYNISVKFCRKLWRNPKNKIKARFKPTAHVNKKKMIKEEEKKNVRKK